MTEKNDSFPLPELQILKGFKDEQASAIHYAGWLVDGRAGGLIVGRKYPSDSILCFVRHPDGSFSNILVEGFEYIINPYAAANNQTRLQELNAFENEYPPLIEIPLSLASRIINTSAEPEDKFILLTFGSFIINQRATAKHFAELEEINNSLNKHNIFDKNFLNPDYWDENGNFKKKPPR